MKKYFWGILCGGCLLSHPLFAQEFLLETISESVSEPEIPAFHLSYTWGDFLMEKSCLVDFNQLQSLPFLSQEQRTLRDKMQTYCVNKITVWDTLLKLFRQNKKALLIHKTLKENGQIVGYVKALPYYLFDVHDQAPAGNSLRAKMDRIQNAIHTKNPEQITHLMQDLSPDEQLFFMPLFNEANTLIDFKEALSESEDNND